MALIRARLIAVTLGFVGAMVGDGPGWTQSADMPAREVPSQIGKPPDTFEPTDAEAQPDVWIFSGELQNSHETFSGTLVAGKDGAQFELKLAGGATCDGSNVAGDVGLVRLSEITCTDDRMMRALFVPQGGQDLKVFGQVGDERFVSSAHLLDTDAVPEKKPLAPPRFNR